MYDIIIVGAGPAGSNLARLLGSKTNYSVCLIEKRRLDLEFDTKRQKACGGLLSPDAQYMLARMGLTIPISVLEDPQLFSVRTIDFDNGLDRHYQRYYYNMDREKFDRYLFNLVPKSVDLKCGTRVINAELIEDIWHLDFKTDEKKVEVLKSKYLVIADGANSNVRKQLKLSQHTPDKYISVQKWYKMVKDMPYYTGIFDTEVTDYYSWTIQKNDALILGTAIPYGENVEEKFEILRKKTEKYLDITLEDEIKKEGAFIERTMNIRDLLWSGNKCALIGEAAGATSPTSAEGFSYAFKSSLYLAEELKIGFEDVGKRYNKRCRKIALNIVGKTIKLPAMYNKSIRKVVMKSGITAMKMSESVDIREK